MISTLETARLNHEFRLEQALELLSARFEPAAYAMLPICFRVLGICSYAMDSDDDRFFDFLYRAAYSRIAFLEKTRSEKEAVEPIFLALSKDMGFACAVSASDWQVAGQIVALSSRSPELDVEYEDDFLFFRALHLLVAGEPSSAEFSATLDRWEEVLDGAESGYFQICKAFTDADPEAFTLAFSALIESRNHQLDSYSTQPSADAELLAVERAVFVEGLAVAKLAARYGFDLQDEFPLVPAALIGSVPPRRPDQSSWMRVA